MGHRLYYEGNPAQRLGLGLRRLRCRSATGANSRAILRHRVPADATTTTTTELGLSYFVLDSLYSLSKHPVVIVRTSCVWLTSRTFSPQPRFRFGDPSCRHASSEQESENAAEYKAYSHGSQRSTSLFDGRIYGTAMRKQRLCVYWCAAPKSEHQNLSHHPILTSAQDVEKDFIRKYLRWGERHALPRVTVHAALHKAVSRP